jgi:hypothetical protein
LVEECANLAIQENLSAIVGRVYLEAKSRVKLDEILLKWITVLESNVHEVLRCQINVAHF